MTTPTAAEWTAEGLKNAFGQIGWKNLADEINSALAAERKARVSEQERSDIFERALNAEREKLKHADKVIGVMQSDWQTEVQQLREQLAAEEDEHGRITANIAMQVQTLTHKLNAERKKHERTLIILDKATQQLRDQLAAEREYVEARRNEIYAAWEKSETKLREQLADERLKRMQAERDLFNEANVAARNVELRQQLDAAVEAINDLSGYDHDRAKMWLAKLGEGK